MRSALKALVVAAVVVPSLASAQSLGDYARRQQQKKAAAQGGAKSDASTKTHPCAVGDKKSWELEAASRHFNYFENARQILAELNTAKDPLPDKADAFDLNLACGEMRTELMYELCGAEVDLRYLGQDKIAKLGQPPAWKFAPGTGVQAPLNERVVAKARDDICAAYARRGELRREALARRKLEAERETARDQEAQARSAQAHDAARSRAGGVIKAPGAAPVAAPEPKPVADPCASSCARLKAACPNGLAGRPGASCTAAFAEAGGCLNICLNR